MLRTIDKYYLLQFSVVDICLAATGSSTAVSTHIAGTVAQGEFPPPWFNRDISFTAGYNEENHGRYEYNGSNMIVFVEKQQYCVITGKIYFIPLHRKNAGRYSLIINPWLQGNSPSAKSSLITTSKGINFFERSQLKILC